MTPEIPVALREAARSWNALNREGRRRLGRDLRQLGLSYGEIRQLVDVPKGTLAGWCSDIALTADQVAALRDRTGSQRGVPRDTQRKRRLEVEAITREAKLEVPVLINKPLWAAGVALYWGEGSKVRGCLSLSNSDPRILRLFMAWVDKFLVGGAEYVLKVNIHADNDYAEAKRFWRRQLLLPAAKFYRPYVKPDGTGHRRNHLAHGVCAVRVRRSTDAWLRTMAWIDALESELHDSAGTIAPGR